MKKIATTHAMQPNQLYTRNASDIFLSAAMPDLASKGDKTQGQQGLCTHQHEGAT